MSSMSSVTCPQCGFVSWRSGGACRRCSGSLADAPTYQFQPPVATTDVSNGAPLYFSVSPTKLAVMNVCTLGFYGAYWVYKQWQTIKHNEGSNISPFWRTIFSIFYLRALFRSVKETAALYDVEANYRPGVLMFAFIALNCCSRLGSGGWLISLLDFYPLMVVQKVANQINATVAPAHDRNENFTAGNIIVCLLGGLFLALALVGTFLVTE